MTHQPTTAWMIQSWLSFAIATLGSAAGIFVFGSDLAHKGFLLLAYFFTVSATFGLAKAIRDRHELEQLHHKLDRARIEMILRDLDRGDDSKAVLERLA